MALVTIDVKAAGIAQGGWNHGQAGSESNKCRCTDAFYIEASGIHPPTITSTLTVSTGKTVNVSLMTFETASHTTEILTSGWQDVPYTMDISSSTTSKYVLCEMRNSDTSNVTPDQITAWTITYDDGIAFEIGDSGYPEPIDAPEPTEHAMTAPYPDSLFHIDSAYNRGYPFTALMPNIEHLNLWILPQRPLIHVYGEKTTNFNTNGYAIIEPISCEVYHEENGEYSAQFETYCDEYGKFTYLHKQAQVKIPIRYHGEVSWQIFRVMNTHRIMNADGTYRIQALAYHKFYDNNNFLIKSAHPTGMSGITALPYICTHSLYNSQIYPFDASSDIAAGKTAYYDNMSITNALLGADQCFVNRWGGKLYRDNLHFSINSEMEHSKSAGVISYAYNLTDIDFEEDDTELITDLIAEDNFGNSYHIGVPDSELRVPNRIYAYRSFYYDEEDVQAFHADAAAYLDEYKQSVVNITVNFLNLSELDKYKEFQQLDAYEVGDRVIIYHKDLDIYYSHLEIISKRYDVVKRRTVEIQIGDFKNAITQRAYMSDTISDGQTAQDKMNAQLFAQDTKIMSVSISGMETFDIFALEKRTINELEGR